MLNKIQIDQIRHDAENGTATSKDCLELLGHMDECELQQVDIKGLVKKIKANITDFVETETEIYLSETKLAEFMQKNR